MRGSVSHLVIKDLTNDLERATRYLILTGLIPSS